MKPLLSLLIDNEPQTPTCFAIPAMNLSSSRAAMQRHSFSISVRADDLVTYLEPAYSSWIVESRKDDELGGTPQDELARAGYPSLCLLIKDPQLLELVVGSYLLHEFLDKLTWDGTSSIKYWLDSVSECRVESGLLRLDGACYSKVAKNEA